MHPEPKSFLVMCAMSTLTNRAARPRSAWIADGAGAVSDCYFVNVPSVMV